MKKIFIILLSLFLLLYPQNAWAATIDSYSESNYNDPLPLCSDCGAIEWGQALTLSSAYSITSAKFYLKKTGSPTGNCYAKFYAAQGSPGSTGKPTGSSLATSDAVDVSTLTTSLDLYEFTFSTPYSASAGDYCIMFCYSGGGVPDYPFAGADSSGEHAGNTCDEDTASGSYDTCFYLYGTAIAAPAQPIINIF